MKTLSFKQGSGAVDGINEVIFLVAPCNTIGDVAAQKADWFRGRSAWEVLDEAKKDFGHAAIIKSCLAETYDAFCFNNCVD